MHMTPDEISDELLTEMIEKGIGLYHEKEDEINEAPALEQKRKVLCESLKTIAINHLETVAS